MNPQMLQLLRESRGMSSSQLAAAIEVSAGTMSKIEHGLASVDPDRKARIAEALSYPESAFDWTDEIHGFGSSVFYHRKQQSLSQLLLRKIQAQVNLTRMRLVRLLKSVEIDTRYQIPTLDIIEVGGASEAARAVRAYWSQPMGPIRNMHTVLERAGVVVIRADLESPKISAISIPPLDGAPHIVFVNKSQPADRERFTLAHELGHFVLHGDLESPESAEREADEFAAEFLMPAAEIRQQLKGITLQKAAQLKGIWRVSMAALIRRARDTGAIEESRYRSLNVQISQRGWRQVEPAPVSRDEPSVLRDLLRVNLDEHEFTPTELAEIVGLNEAEFAERYGVTTSSGVVRGHLRAV